MEDKKFLSPDHYLVIHSTDPRQKKIRIDHFLKTRYPFLSRRTLQKIIHSGSLQVRRTQTYFQLSRLKPSLILQPGDEVLISRKKKKEPEVNFQYQILYEDPFLLVINKSAPLPVHPAGSYFFHTLLTHLKLHHTDPQLEKYFLTHRIDKETSGILVLAKSKKVCANLTQQFAHRKIQKKYLAIVKGQCPTSFEVHHALRRSKTSQIRIKMEITPEVEKGQKASTQFQRIETFQNYSLLECIPLTGRQHQIRVHLKSFGYPIVGDKLYSLNESQVTRLYNDSSPPPEMQTELIFPRHALHAFQLQFQHPVLNKTMNLCAPLPEDFCQFLKMLRLTGLTIVNKSSRKRNIRFPIDS